MRAILDTNVLMSGIFFGGIPRTILEAWRDRRLNLVFSPTPIIVSGDQDLLGVSGYQGIEVLKPRDFVKQHLNA